MTIRLAPEQAVQTARFLGTRMEMEGRTVHEPWKTVSVSRATRSTTSSGDLIASDACKGCKGARCGTLPKRRIPRFVCGFGPASALSLNCMDVPEAA